MRDGEHARACSAWGRTRPSAGRTPAGAPGAGEARLAGRARHLSRSRRAAFWYDAPEVDERRGRARRTSGPRSSCCPPPSRPRRTARTPTPMRLVQWHDKAVEPPGRLPLRGLVRLPPGPAAEELYADSDSPARPAAPGAHLGLPASGATREPDARAVVKEINGYTVADGKLVPHYNAAEGRRLHGLRLLDLHRDHARGGPEPGARAARATTGPRSAGASPGRPTCASSTTAPPPIPQGRPGASARRGSGGTPTQGKWTGHDVPDFPPTKPPDYQPPPDAQGPRRPPRRRAVRAPERRPRARSSRRPR